MTILHSVQQWEFLQAQDLPKPDLWPHIFRLWIYLRQVSPKGFCGLSSPTKRIKKLHNIMHVPIVIWERYVLFWGVKIWSEIIGLIGKASTILSVTLADQNINLIYLKLFPLLLCTRFEFSVSDSVGLYCSESQGWSAGSPSGHVLLYKTQVFFCGRLWNTSWSFSLMKIFIALEAERIVSYWFLWAWLYDQSKNDSIYCSRLLIFSLMTTR